MSNYDINVLVNGSRCKQYLHKKRTYIEAKEGSEYVIEIKNNSWEKALAVVSVDGLNIVDGEAASEQGTGYVLDSYTAQKFYGFQYSKDQVATFKFGAFGEKDADGNALGYAASKGDGSEKNAGIIGVRIWNEIKKPTPPPPPVVNWTFNWSTGSSYAITSSFSLGGLPGNWSSTTFNCAGNIGLGTPNPHGKLLIGHTSELLNETKLCATTCNSSNDYKAKFDLANMSEDYYDPIRGDIDNQQYSCNTIACASSDVASFDMETQWGTSRTFKVKETDFERNSVVHSIDIYYASRESLVAMGVDLGTERRVSFPESFKNSKYAKPPKGWKGN